LIKIMPTTTPARNAVIIYLLPSLRAARDGVCRTHAAALMAGLANRH
jgi:hypothetical protein